MKLVKYIKDLIIVPLTKLYNRCIREGIFPRCLKVAKVVPIPKKGDTSQLEGYRPISVIPTFAKIFENILNCQLYDYFEGNNLLSHNQFGFRRGRSTTDALLELVRRIVDGFELGIYVHAVFCDLSRAFDCVPPAMLVDKLRHYRLSGDSVGLIASYLSDRSQRTVFGGETSQTSALSYGVPQGSVLGPLLFIIYMNDIAMGGPDYEHILYADDTTVVGRSPSLDLSGGVVCGARSSVFDWFLANRLTANEAKTYNMTFSQRNIPPEFNINKSVKFLGLLLDPKLTWEEHVLSLTARLSGITFLFRNLVETVPFPVVLTAYYAIFQATYTYGLLVWGHCAHLSAVFGLQRRILRIMFRKGFREDVREIFRTAGILTVPSMYIWLTLLFVKKNIHNFITVGEVNNSYATRNTGNIAVSYARLNKSRYSVNYWGPRFFNALPVRIRNLPYNQFKNVTRSVLIDRAFYNLSEYLAYSFDELNG